MKWLYQQDNELGELVYRFWSAITHATMYGLANSLDTSVPQERRTNSLVTAGLAVTSDGVNLAVRAVGLAYIRVALAHHDLFGWETDAWKHTVRNFLNLARQLRPIV